jgi:O-antigen/teichoic acid export membrane protein
VRSVYALFKIVTRLTDLGLDYAAVTFASAALGRDDADDSRNTFGTVLALKLGLGIGVLLVGNLLAEPIASWALGDARLTPYARLAFLAVGGQLLWRYLQSHLTAHRRFATVGLYLTTVPSLMLVAFFGLSLAGLFSVHSAILIYLFAPAATVALWWPLAGADLVRIPSWSRTMAGKIVRFSRWIYASSLVSATRANLNPLLLKNPALSGSIAAGEVSAGLYGFGHDLANEVTIFSQSLITILLPAASGKTTPRKLLGFVKRAYLHLVPVLAVLAFLVFAAEPFILILGWIRESYLEYLPSAAAFKLLYISGLVSVATIPIQTALYAAKLPQMETYVELSTVVILIGGSLVLIPRYGPIGAAAALLVQRSVASLVLVVWGVARLKRLESL